jgi:chromosome segregation ATPase
MSEELLARLRTTAGNPAVCKEAAATIARLTRERAEIASEAIEATSRYLNAEYELETAESELAKAREALDEAKLVAVELQRTNDAWVRQDKALSAELAKVTRERDAAQVMDRLQGARAVAAESELAKAKEALIRIANENYEPIDGSFTMAAAAIADAALPPKPEDKP